MCVNKIFSPTNLPLCLYVHKSD